MIADKQDAFGHMMKDFLDGNLRSTPVIQRNDGAFDADVNPDFYFSRFGDWMPSEREAMRFVKGRVLDIGCGAGRHALYLQEQGHEVVAIDNSPLALETARKRGVKDTRLCSINQLNKKLGLFDSVILMGNNFALVGTPEAARKILAKMAMITTADARVFAHTLDPYKTTNPDHLFFHAANKAAGKLGGQMKLKYIYGKFASPWFGFLLTSKAELEKILEGTAWHVKKYLDDAKYPANYITILVKR